MNKKELRVEHQKKLNTIDSLFNVNRNLKDINTNLTDDLSVSEKSNRERLSTINSLESIIDELNLEIENVKDERTRLSDVNLGLNEMIVALSDSIMSVTNQLNYQLGIYRDQNISFLDIDDWVGGVLTTGNCYSENDSSTVSFIGSDGDYWMYFYETAFQIVSMEYDNYQNIMTVNFGDEYYAEGDLYELESDDERMTKIKVIGDSYYFLDLETMEIDSYSYRICF